MTPPEETISCKGVRTHNLKNINVEIPKGKWVSITGVSGSGKSSLAFDTLFAESQRRFLETLGTYERQFLEGLPNGEFDSIDNIPPAIALKQSSRANDPRSVIATTSDLGEPLRLLFALAMEPSCSRCGSPVTTSEPNELSEALKKQLQNLDTPAAILAVRYTWPTDELQSLIISKNMLSEGYSRVIVNEKSLLLEDLVSEKKSLSGEHSLVLDRIGSTAESEELQNRVFTAWSQVRYSPRFQTLEMIPLDKRGNPLRGHQIDYETQPFCGVCKTSTTTIQQGDLDWQSAIGACPRCEGIGNIPVIDKNKVIPDESKSIAEGAIKPWTSATFQWMSDEVVKVLRVNGISPQVAYRDLPQGVKEWIWTGNDSTKTILKKSADAPSINDFFNVLEAERYKSTSRILLAKYRRYITCPECEGSRLRESGRNAQCAGALFRDIMNNEIGDVDTWLDILHDSPRFKRIEDKASDLFAEVKRKISILKRLGLSSSSLWRRCKTLSGGEYQRVLLTRVLGNGLTDALYVLDEPSVGLGKSELPELVACLRELRDLGNTIVMVEHDRYLIECSDLWIELGPGGGSHGGKLLAKQSGMPRSAVPKSTSKSISHPTQKNPEKKQVEKVRLSGFSALNCRNLSCEFTIGSLSVISGPSGAGKSTLLRMGIDAALAIAGEHGRLSNTDINIDQSLGIWEKISLPSSFFNTTEIVSIEQKAAHRSISSVIATTLGVMDFMRRQFAQSDDARRYDMTAGDFSFNSSGACATCEGRGEIDEDLFFLGEVKKSCPDCAGTRYCSASLRARWLGRTIAEWLNTTIDECLSHWDPFPMPRKQLRLAADLGLGYLPIGTPTSALSGGELQRLRIAAALSTPGKKMFCLLDEPTRGLSETDIESLLDTIVRLTRLGHTFVVVEHHERFCERAHQLILMGPKGGKAGGQIVETLVRLEVSN